MRTPLWFPPKQEEIIARIDDLATEVQWAAGLGEVEDIQALLRAIRNEAVALKLAQVEAR